MAYPGVSEKKTVGLLALAALLLVVSAATYFVLRPAPTEEVIVNRPVLQPVPKPKYEDLVERERNAATEATRRAQRHYDASVKQRIAVHASQTAAIADQAADRAAEFETLTKTIYYLAQDQVTGGKETDRHLQEQIGPIVEPGLQSLASVVNADIAAFDFEVRRITVQMATNLAAIGPGAQPAPPRVVPPATIGSEFTRVVDGLGGKFAYIGAGVGLNVIPEAVPKTMIKKLSQMCAGIALRLFGKQVAKLISSAAIGAATGPFEIVVLVGSIIWTGYDVWNAQNEYRDEVRTTMKNQLEEADRKLSSGADRYFSERTADFISLQTAIATKALEDIQKRAPK